MATNELKLLGCWFSPFTCRVKFALNIKSLDYNNIEETFHPRSDLVLQSNPIYKKIPVLSHGDKIICESAIIVEYIDEVWKDNGASSILPSNDFDRAMARFWVSYMDDKLFNSMRNGLIAQDEESKKKHFKRVEEVFVTLEDVINKCKNEGMEFFGGDKIGFIDICFGCYMSWVRAAEKIEGIKLLDDTKTPALVKWAEAFDVHPAVKGVVPEMNKLVEFVKGLVKRLVDATPK
ncbi:unnamed protein product [Lathyrus sativus]|nr:unnamed protein product [Lathyrus sativus]